MQLTSNLTHHNYALPVRPRTGLPFSHCSWWLLRAWKAAVGFALVRRLGCTDCLGLAAGKLTTRSTRHQHSHLQVHQTLLVTSNCCVSTTTAQLPSCVQLSCCALVRNKFACAARYSPAAQLHHHLMDLALLMSVGCPHPDHRRCSV